VIRCIYGAGTCEAENQYTYDEMPVDPEEW